MKRVTVPLAVCALGLAGLIGSATPAAAANRPAASGLCGSRNMSNGGEGMALAMSRNNPNGVAGMVHAHSVSGC